MERRRITADLQDRATGKQFRRTQHHFAAIARFDPRMVLMCGDGSKAED